MGSALFERGEEMNNNLKAEERLVEHYQREYVDSLTAESAGRAIRKDMTDVARCCVSIGFHLKAVRDRKLYMEMGYENLWDYAADQFGLSMSSTSRYIAINDRFSVGGNTPQLLPEYSKFSKSQLQEMLNMTPEQAGQVTEDMTVKEIRKLKNPEPEKSEQDVVMDEKSVATSQESLSICGLPLKEYPEGSLIATPGCGTHDCFDCHQAGCGIRQQFCYCVEAPLANPFPCEMLDKVSRLRKEKPDACQFLDYSLAYHRAGDGEAVPCCKRCENLCEYACGRAKKALGTALPAPEEPDQEDTDEIICDDCINASALTGNPDLCAGCCDGSNYAPFPHGKEPEAEKYPEESGLSDMELLRSMLKRENEQLSKYLEVDKVEKLPEDMIRKKKIVVAALASMLHGLEENEEKQEPIQPDLPLMRNNEQRREWLSNYKDWGLWYEDSHTGAKYYKYDFENGARLIAETYMVPETEFYIAHESCYFHLAGGPEPVKKNGVPKWGWNEVYNRYPNSASELVEFLKELQKKGGIE